MTTTLTEADVELAERYAAALKTAQTVLEEMMSPTLAHLRALSDEQLLARLEAARPEAASVHKRE